jgi:hypothetical protein
MWESKAEQVDKGVLLRLFNDDSPLSFSDYFTALSDDMSFITWYTELLAGSNLISFFWEHPPLTVAAMELPAEFVLTDAPSLTGLRANQATFSNQFEGASPDSILVFDNLGGDATLVVPHTPDDTRNCAHISPFVRAASAKLVCEFWQTVAQTVIDSVSEQPLWLSTSGLGVSWLHVRLDSQPKYYQYLPYKQATW